MCISIPLNCLLSYFFFQEKLTKQIIIGCVIIVSGVIWVSLAKGKVIETSEIDLTEYDQTISRLLSISAALFAGFLSSMRVFQAKYISRKSGYSPLDFSLDAGLFSGLCLLLLATYFFFVDNDPTYTLYNLTIATLSSSLLMFTTLIAVNASVKGLAGPTSAIINTNPIV